MVKIVHNFVVMNKKTTVFQLFPRVYLLKAAIVTAIFVSLCYEREKYRITFGFHFFCSVLVLDTNRSAAFLIVGYPLRFERVVCALFSWFCSTEHLNFFNLFSFQGYVLTKAQPQLALVAH